MKKNILFLLVAVALLGSSCESFLDVNEENPNFPSKVAAKLVLPGAVNNIAYTMNNPRRFDFVYLWHGLWSISAGYSQPDNLTQYRLLNSNYQNAFNEFYTYAQNLTEIEKSTNPKEVNYVAIAKIMKCYIFQNLVDCWGNVPYSDAFKAPKNLKPKYDDQQAIYEDLVLQLDKAIELIQTAPFDAEELSSSSDIIYKGDMAKWLKFANTLKLRILIHQADMAGRTAYIQERIATTASVGYLGAGEGALANPGFLSSETKMNPFYEIFYKADGSSQSDGITYYFAGKDVVDYMNATADTRVGKFFQPYSGTSYAGNYFGHKPADLASASNTSKLGYIKGDPTTMIGTADKPAPILTDFEALFIQAEAAARGLITGDAKALYESAVTQSYIYMGLTASQAYTFYSQVSPKVSYDNAGNKIELIITEKWVALNGIAPVEIWTDYRRTGYPNWLTFSVYTERENDTPPVRLLYPQREITVNNDNVVAVGTIDPFTSKIFWQNR